MNRHKIILIIISIISLLIAFSSIYSEWLTLESTEEDFIFGIVSTFSSWIKGILMVGILIYSGLKLFRNKKMGFILPLAVTIIHFVVIQVIQSIFEQRESSPIVLHAHYYGDINGISLFLRKNNTYKIDDFSILGGTCHYGKYILKGDTIVLSEKYPLGADRDIMGNKLLKTKEFILIKPNSNGQYDENEYIKLRIIQ